MAIQMLHLDALTDEQYRAAVAVAAAANYACGVNDSSRGTVPDEVKEQFAERLRTAIEALAKIATSSAGIVESARNIVARAGVCELPYDEIQDTPGRWTTLVIQVGDLRKTRSSFLPAHPDLAECFSEDDDERLHTICCDLQSSAQTLAGWLRDFEDVTDIEIARRRVAEISSDPDSLVTGEAAEAEIRALIGDE